MVRVLPVSPLPSAAMVVPSLVLLSQRAAISNLHAIHSLGHLDHTLVRPILARSTPEQLSRFEQLSPHLEMHTSDIWRDLCFQIYHLTAAERFSPDDDPHPDSWRSRFFSLQELEAKRIDHVASKIRSQRLEADERKKEKEVKLTDRLPPAKRPRTVGWNTISQPKTLFQKTRTEASKIQRALNARILPPSQSRIHRPSGSSLPSAVSPIHKPNVKSTSVHHRPSIPISTIASTSNTVDVQTPLADDLFFTPPSQSTIIPSETPRPLPKMRSPPKRDPMASLFVPKRKPRPT